MGRPINLNKEFYPYLTKGLKESKELTANDKTVASYLIYLESTRRSKGDEEHDYIYPSYEVIKANTGIHAKQTVAKSLNNLQNFGVIKVIKKGNSSDGCNRYVVSDDCINLALSSNINESDTSSTLNPNSDSEILTKLFEEIKSLRGEVRDMKEEITNLKEKEVQDSEPSIISVDTELIPEVREEKINEIEEIVTEEKEISNKATENKRKKGSGGTYLFGDKSKWSLNREEIIQEFTYRFDNNLPSSSEWMNFVKKKLNV